jgi:putative DNA primase/helicase
MKTWEPPAGVKSVVVFGDNDANFTGQDAAYTLAHRLALLKLAVEVMIPTAVGTDWADLHTSPNPTVAA